MHTEPHSKCVKRDSSDLASNSSRTKIARDVRFDLRISRSRYREASGGSNLTSAYAKRQNILFREHILFLLRYMQAFCDFGTTPKQKYFQDAARLPFALAYADTPAFSKVQEEPVCSPHNCVCICACMLCYGDTEHENISISKYGTKTKDTRELKYLQ